MCPTIQPHEDKTTGCISESLESVNKMFLLFKSLHLTLFTTCVYR